MAADQFKTVVTLWCILCANFCLEEVETDVVIFSIKNNCRLSLAKDKLDVLCEHIGCNFARLRSDNNTPTLKLRIRPATMRPNLLYSVCFFVTVYV